MVSALIRITLILPYPLLRHKANDNYRNPQEAQCPMWAVMSRLVPVGSPPGWVVYSHPPSQSCHKQKKDHH